MMMRYVRPLAAFRCSPRISGRLLSKFTSQVEDHLLKLKTPPRAFCNSSAAVLSAFDAGQPIPETHPELLLSGEIMPGITTAEIASRRKKLMALLPRESLVIMSSATVKQMTDIVPYPFRQNADYLYYTGCQQLGGIAVLGDEAEFCMFMPDPNPEREAWEGHVAGTAEAISILKADRAYNLSQLSQFLPSMIKRAKAIYVNTMPTSVVLNKLPAFKEAVQEKKVHNSQKYTHEARWIKSRAEIDLMRHSAAITCQAFLQTMKVSRTWPHEHILAATVEYECKIKGAQRMAFPPVVGGGVNGTIIHYSRNDQRVKEGEMLLMDAGCEYYGYASDVTRTWSPFGSFSTAQREIYEIVLSTLKECLELCQPGATLHKIHEHSADMLFRAVTNIGLIQDPYQKGRDETSQFLKYWRINPTAIGHYLGMDVHDCSYISKERRLEPGVVITIEPGLYIPVRDDIPKRFQGIGVRIEDEVLITDSGHEVLSASIPKEINEIEAWLQC